MRRKRNQTKELNANGRFYRSKVEEIVGALRPAIAIFKIIHKLCAFVRVCARMNKNNINSIFVCGVNLHVQTFSNVFFPWTDTKETFRFG